jgi:hypothetical protein
LGRLNILLPFLPLLTIWVAVAAVASIAVRELGWSRAKKYPLTLLVLVISLGALPTGAALKIGRPYQRRITAMLFREKSPSIIESGCTIFPANNIWNTRIADADRDPHSVDYVGSIGADGPLHVDFGPAAGIPYIVTDGSEPTTHMTFGEGTAESDRGDYRIPENSPLEGGSDSHTLVLNRKECVLYELYRAAHRGPNEWFADSAAIFDLRSNKLRPAGWTSADAAGLPIVAGLARYDEVEAGKITHAIRFTARQTQRAYVWPATHYASRSLDPRLPPMGQRFRLRRTFDTSGYSAQAQILLTAFKEYGIILADNGGNWFISGAPDSRWASTLPKELAQVKGLDFEAVNLSRIMISPDSAEAR